MIKIIDALAVALAWIAIVFSGMIAGLIAFPCMLISWIAQFSGFRVTGLEQKIPLYHDKKREGASDE